MFNMLKHLFKKKPFNEIPLFYVVIDKEKFSKEKKGSCSAHMHPCFNKLDQETRKKIQNHIGDAIDIFRNNVTKKDL